jgi:hypothetical protein
VVAPAAKSPGHLIVGIFPGADDTSQIRQSPNRSIFISNLASFQFPRKTNSFTSRYRSMVTDYVTPMDKTYGLLGQPKISLAQGVEETLTWLRIQAK